MGRQERAQAPETAAGTPAEPAASRPDLHDPEQRATVEAALTSIPGVASVRIVPGYDRLVDEVHAIVDLDKAPKQAVRDLQTLLMARYDVATDHRVFSVVQLDVRDSALLAPRLVLDHVTVTHAGAAVRVNVAVHDGGGATEGYSEGTATPTGRTGAVARATLSAVRPHLPVSTLVELEGAEVVPQFGHRVATCLLRAQGSRGDRLLVGAALVRDAEEDAVARSVLDALNRVVADGPD
jgi:hypothetical protein